MYGLTYQDQRALELGDTVRKTNERYSGVVTGIYNQSQPVIRWQIQPDIEISSYQDSLADLVLVRRDDMLSFSFEGRNNWDGYEVRVLEFLADGQPVQVELFMHEFPSIWQYEHLYDSDYITLVNHFGAYVITARGLSMLAYWNTL